jgi:putative redox protein
VFTAIHLHFVVSGVGLPEAAVERAIALSHEKYCSATIMLASTASITTSHEVVAVPASIDPRSGLPGTAQT